MNNDFFISNYLILFSCCFFQFISDYAGEDRFMTKIGVGGLINMEKIQQSHVILNDINLFQEHARIQERQRVTADSDSEKDEKNIYEDDSDYDLNTAYHSFAKSTTSNHGVMMISPSHRK